eukprot:140035-Prymnesium_polylepis.1
MGRAHCWAWSLPPTCSPHTFPTKVNESHVQALMLAPGVEDRILAKRRILGARCSVPVSYTHLRAHETLMNL